MKNNITWKHLIQEDSRLQDLLNEILEIKDSGGDYFCANEVWRGKKFKKRMSKLVGWEASSKRAEFMRSEEAYDIAYNKLYRSLPDCRNCSCLDIQIDRNNK